MKKRDFLKAAAASAVMPMSAIAADTTEQRRRLFGTPGSLDPSINRHPLIKLAISRSELPVRTWNEVEQFSYLLGHIFDDDSARREFVESPDKYFQKFGLDIRDYGSLEHEINFLRIAFDESIQKSIANGLYEPLFRAFRDSGLHTGNSSALAARVAVAIKEDFSKYKELLERNSEKNLIAASAAAIAQDVNANGDIDGNVYSHIVIITEVAAVAAVSVAAVALLIVYLVVTNPQLTDLSRKVGGHVGRLDDKLLADYVATAQMANFLGQPNLEALALRELVHQEYNAIFDAAIATGLINDDTVGTDGREKVLKQLDDMLLLQ